MGSVRKGFCSKKVKLKKLRNFLVSHFLHFSRFHFVSCYVPYVPNIFVVFVCSVIPGHQSQLSDYVKLLMPYYEHRGQIKHISMNQIA